MVPDFTKPRILIVTPEISYLPDKLSPISDCVTARAGELADFSASLMNALYEYGADVHVALPDYRSIFNNFTNPFFQSELNLLRTKIADTRVHLAQDQAFFSKKNVYSDSDQENLSVSLFFQREVINTIISHIQPDLIHCNDWMTGLIPAMARKLGIPCLFTIHNLYNLNTLLSSVEERGIDAEMFWEYLIFERQPFDYEETRDNNPVDFLASGIFAAHHVNTSSPRFLWEMIIGKHKIVDPFMQTELLDKVSNGCASGIINYPDPSFSPKTDSALFQNYDEGSHVRGKKANKVFLQEKLNIIKDPKAPLFFWPHFLHQDENDSDLFAALLREVVSTYWNQNIEIVFVTNGKIEKQMTDIIRDFNLKKHMAVCEFSESFCRIAYGASDFILMPSVLESGGLQHIIGPLYGALPIAYDAGGIHDTIKQLDIDHDSGNGFLFHQSDIDGLFQSIDQALRFYNSTQTIKAQQIKRIMKQSAAQFHHSETAAHYIELYGKMLKRPIINH